MRVHTGMLWASTAGPSVPRRSITLSPAAPGKPEKMSKTISLTPCHLLPIVSPPRDNDRLDQGIPTRLDTRPSLVILEQHDSGSAGAVGADVGEGSLYASNTPASSFHGSRSPSLTASHLFEPRPYAALHENQDETRNQADAEWEGRREGERLVGEASAGVASQPSWQANHARGAHMGAEASSKKPPRAPKVMSTEEKVAILLGE